MELGATDLGDLLGGAPVQAPAFAPMVGGGDPFITPLPPAQVQQKAPDYSQQFSILRGSVRGVLTYLGFFLAALTFSLSKPRELLLPYIPIPSIYGEGGILTWTGAAVIGGLTTVLAYILNTVIYTLV
jgi:hypothetical protein